MNRFLPIAALSLTLGHAAEKSGVTWGDLGDGSIRFSLHGNPGAAFQRSGQLEDHRPGVSSSVFQSEIDDMAGYAEGTWAPSLRYRNGEFYLYVCTPADGLFMWHAKDPTALCVK